MIKECLYRGREFEIHFEWPLSKQVIEENRELKAFMEKIASIPGTRFLREEEKIIALVLSYEGWRQLLNRHRAERRGVQLSEEFGRFFANVQSKQT